MQSSGSEFELRAPPSSNPRYVMQSDSPELRIPILDIPNPETRLSSSGSIHKMMISKGRRWLAAGLLKKEIKTPARECPGLWLSPAHVLLNRFPNALVPPPEALRPRDGQCIVIWGPPSMNSEHLGMTSQPPGMTSQTPGMHRHFQVKGVLNIQPVISYIPL